MEKEKKKPKVLFNVTWLDLIILAVFVFFIWLVFDLTEQGNQCLVNPFVYGAQEVTHENNDLICSCQFTDNSYARFQFNKERINHEGGIGLFGGQVSGQLFEDFIIETINKTQNPNSPG